MKEINEYMLGETILTDHMLKRTKMGNERKWMPERLKKPTSVIIVGIRRLSNGRIDQLSKDEFSGFLPKLYFPAILVTRSLHSKPFYVLHEFQGQ